MFRPLAFLILCNFIVPHAQGASVDESDLLRYRKGAQETVSYLARLNTRAVVPAPDDRDALLSTWAVFLDYIYSLDGQRTRYAHAQEKQDVALSYAAFLAIYRSALEWIDEIEKSPASPIVLNEAQTPTAYKDFKFRFLNVAMSTQFIAYQAVYAVNRATGPLDTVIQEDKSAIWKMGSGRGELLTFKNGFDILNKTGSTAWFPIQKSAAEWAGDTRVHGAGKFLISAEQITALKTKLRPGDFFLERREWFLSNVGLPGFWTHAALYIGTPEERAAYFADGGELDRMLEKSFPAAYKTHLEPYHGEPACILEAVGEGVSFTSLEHTAYADSLVVLRPRLPKKDIAQALQRAFQYAGRPYDYEFDFVTDAALVCSELIYKVFKTSAGSQGIVFPLVSIAGRPMLPPNEIARMFDQEKDGLAPQLDLVAFLDGSERKNKASDATAEEFRTSWKRPKWHAVVK